jgi:hypothetical protein
MKKKISFLDLFQTVAIVFGILYGVLELGQLREETNRQSAAELARWFQTTEYLAGMVALEEIPDDASPEQVREALDGREELLWQVAMVTESVGVLVWRGDLDLRLVDDLAGGGIIQFWETTKPLWLQIREDWDRPATMEWTQWLADRLGELPTLAEAPAHEAFRDWVPPR